MIADNMERLARFAAVLCSIARDLNYELAEQGEQCVRIIDKVRQLLLLVVL